MKRDRISILLLTVVGAFPCVAEEIDAALTKEISTLIDRLGEEEITGGKSLRRLMEIGTPTTPHLIRVLRECTGRRAALSALALGKIGDRNAIQDIWALYESDSEDRRSNALLCISHYPLDSDSAIPLLRKGLADKSLLVRKVAADGMLMAAQANSAVSDSLKKSCSLLVSCLASSDDDERQAAFGALMQMSSLAHECVPVIVSLLDHNNDKVKAIALQSLLHIDPKGQTYLPKVRALLEVHKSGEVYEASTRLLKGNLPPESQRLEDEEQAVKSLKASDPPKK